MNPYMDEVIAQLEECGIRYILKSEYHVQIATRDPQKFHNVWVNKFGKIRVRIDGNLIAKPLTQDEWGNLLARFQKIRAERRQGNGELGTVLD